MRKRLTLIWVPLVMAALLVAPAATSAASNKTWRVLKNTCTLSGGAYGYGQANLKIRLDEFGWSETAQFRTMAWLEEKRGNRWYDVFDWTNSYSNFFDDNSYSYFWVKAHKYQFGSNARVYYHRIVVLGQWLDYQGNVIAEHRFNGRVC